jgi:hypothetical protein
MSFIAAWLITFAIASLVIFAVFGLMYFIGTGNFIAAGFLAAAIFATVAMLT